MREYEELTADNCCCGICRELGFYNYDEKRDIVRDLDAAVQKATHNRHGLHSTKQLINRIKEEELFRRGQYATHLEEQSNVGHHCIRMLLTSSNDRRFCCECTHEPAEGARPLPETMVEYHRRVLRRKPKVRTWKVYLQSQM